MSDAEAKTISVIANLKLIFRQTTSPQSRAMLTSLSLQDIVLLVLVSVYSNYHIPPSLMDVSPRPPVQLPVLHPWIGLAFEGAKANTTLKRYSSRSSIKNSKPSPYHSTYKHIKWTLQFPSFISFSISFLS